MKGGIWATRSVTNCEAGSTVMDAHGLLIPAPARFPSSAGTHGFKPLADWVHAQGLKFGLHIVRGIPNRRSRPTRPLPDPPFRAVEAADTARHRAAGTMATTVSATTRPDRPITIPCWRSMPVGGWISSKSIASPTIPTRPVEIRQIAAAIRRTGRPIVLSLSPGPTQPAHAAEISEYAQMWRISNDVWDSWRFVHSLPKATISRWACWISSSGCDTLDRTGPRRSLA